MNHPLNSVYHTDCFDLLRGIDDKSADLVILDPNYQDWDTLMTKGLIEEALRVLKPRGNILMFTKKPYDHNLRVKVDSFFRNELIWRYKKNGNWYSKKMPIYSYQKIYWGCGSDFFFNPQTGIPHDKSRGIPEHPPLPEPFVGYADGDENLERCNTFGFDSPEYYHGGQFIKDFLDIPRKREGAIPTKPVELCQILIRCFSPIGGLVVDPFMGGGNIMLTASRERRKFIGGDIDEACFKLASEKIK